MGFLDFFRAPKVDKTLEENLKKKGKTQELDALKRSQPRSTFDQMGKEVAPTLAKAGNATLPFTGGKTLAQGTAGAVVAPEVNKIEGQNLDAQKKMLDVVKARVKAGKVSDEDKKRYVRLFGQMSDVDVSKDIPELNLSNKQIIGDAAQLALTAATGFKPGSQGLVKSGALASAETMKGVKATKAAITAVNEADRIRRLGTAGKVLNYGIKAGKAAAIDAAAGGVAFGANAATQDKSNEEILKEAGTGAAVSAAFPIVAGGVVRGLKAAGNQIVDKVAAPVGRMIEGGLDRLANGASKAERMAAATNEVERTLAVIPKPKGIVSKAASGLLTAIDSAKELPSKLYNRFSTFTGLENKLQEITGRPLSEGERFERNARLASPAAEGKTENMMRDLFEGTPEKPALLGQYKDVEDQVKARLLKLDAISRSEAGQLVASGDTTQELQSGLQKLIGEAGDKDPRINQAVKTWNDLNKKILDEKVEAGLLNPEARDAMLKKYPNYIPHEVIFNADEQAAMELSRRSGAGSSSLNVADNGIKKAVGSERELEDPYVALAHRLYAHNALIEKNKVVQGLVEAQEKHNFIDGMRPLVTAKQVTERRAAIQELSLLKAEAEQIRKSISKTNDVDGKLAARLGKLQAEIDERSNEAIRLYTSEAPAEASKLQAELTTTTKGKSDVQKAVLDRDIYYANKDLKKANEAYEAKRVRIADGEKVTVKAEADALERAKARVQALLDKKNAPPEVLYKYRNTGPTAKAAINEQVAKPITDIERLKGQISTREGKVAETEASKAKAESMLDQLSSTLDDIKERRKSAFEDVQANAAGKKELGEQTVNVFRDGIKETWVVPNDMAVAIKNLDTEQMNKVMRALTAPTRLLKKLSTEYNLSFILPNKVRDEQTALLTADAFIQDLVQKTGATPGGKVDLNQDELYRLWKDSGGAFGSVFDEGSIDLKGLEKIQKTGIREKLANNVRPDQVIGRVNKYFEESTRMQVFKKGLEAGLNPRDAALAARDATVDFAKMGTFMKSLNEIIPFLNARVQGAINIGRAAKLSPETFARMQMWSAVYPTLALQRWNSQFKSADNIPQYFYDNYWPIMVGETEGVDNNGNAVTIPKFISIKKGEGQILVSNPIQYFLRRAAGEDPRRVEQMIASTIGSASPINLGLGDDPNDKSNVFSKFIAQLGPLASIGVGLATNKDPYTGSEIIPDSRKDASPEMQFKQNTPDFTKKIAKLFGASPAEVEFMINSFGGVAQDAQQVANIADGAARGEGLRTNPLEPSAFGEATKLPVASKFVRESTGFGSAKQQAQQQTKQDLLATVTDKKLNVSDKAGEIFTKLNKLKTKEEKLKYLKEEDPSPEVRAKISQLKKSRQSVEVLKPSDSVDLRALYIRQRLLEMKKDNVEKNDRVQFLKDLEDSKILTAAVREKMAEYAKQ